MLSKYLHNISTQHNPDPTINLAQNLSSVRLITQFLLDNHYPTTYQQWQRMVSTQEENPSSSYPLKPTSSNLYMYNQPGLFLYGISSSSIAHYQQCKTVVNFKDKHSLIMSFITNCNKYLLPDLHDYILLKGEQVTPWLSHKLVQRQKSVKFHGFVNLVQHSQEAIKHNASRLDRPGFSKAKYAYSYSKSHSDQVTGSTSSSQLRKAKHRSSCYNYVASGLDVPPSNFTSHLSHAVTMQMAASQPPGRKALSPNSSSSHTTYKEDKPKYTS